jgi:hypothetical protein
MKKIPVENRNDLMRDECSNAIISNNISAYEARKKIIAVNNEKKNELNTLRDEVHQLRDMVTELLEKDNTK